MKNDLTPAQTKFLIALSKGEEITVAASTLNAMIKKGFVYELEDSFYELTECGEIAVSHLTSLRSSLKSAKDEVRIVARSKSRHRDEDDDYEYYPAVRGAYSHNSRSRAVRRYENDESYAPMQRERNDSHSMIAMGLGMAVTGFVYYLLED